MHIDTMSFMVKPDRPICTTRRVLQGFSDDRRGRGSSSSSNDDTIPSHPSITLQIEEAIKRQIEKPCNRSTSSEGENKAHSLPMYVAATRRPSCGLLVWPAARPPQLSTASLGGAGRVLAALDRPMTSFMSPSVPDMDALACMPSYYDYSSPRWAAFTFSYPTAYSLRKRSSCIQCHTLPTS